MSNRPYEQEGQVRTDEQAGAPDSQLKRVEREFDPANPPVAGNDPKDTRVAGEPAKTFRQKSQLRSGEQADAQAEGGALKKAYTDS